MVIYKEKLLEKITFEFILIYAMLSRYFEFTSLGNEIILVLTTLCFFKNARKIRTYLREYREVYVVLFVLLVLIVCNIFSHGIQSYTISNMMVVMYLCVIIICLGFLKFIMSEKIVNLYLANFYIINLFFITNVIVLALQLRGTGFMIKAHWIQINSNYLDQCCGLFGNSGTHELAFFSIFVFVYNWFCSTLFNSKIRKRTIKIYTIVSSIVMYYLSLFNDNKAMLVFFPFVVTIVFILGIYWKGNTISRRMQNLIISIACALFAFAIAIQIPIISELFESLTNSIGRVLNVRYSNAGGGNERLSIFIYAMLQGNGRYTGIGLGRYNWTQGDIGIFTHFGLSSIGSFTLLGGIWYYLTICLLYTFSSIKVFSKRKRQRGSSLFFLVIIILISIYSNIFTSMVSTIWILMIFTVLGTIKSRYTSYNYVLTEE
jgi:hypothetical protein